MTAARDTGTPGAALLRIGLGVAWIVEAAGCDLSLRGDPALAERVIAVIALLAPPLIWAAWIARRLKRLDEMLGRVEITGLVWGAVHAILLQVGVYALFLAGGETSSPGFIVIVPPLAFVLSQIHALVNGWRLSRGEP